MHYGKSIVVAFILFAMFIGTLVTVCIREDVNLVSPDYYEEELAHGQKIRLLPMRIHLSASLKFLLVQRVFGLAMKIFPGWSPVS